MATARERVMGLCYVCSTTISEAKEKLFVLSCCRRSIHKPCLEDRLGALVSKQQMGKDVPCPNCHRRFSIGSMIVHNDTFTVAQTKMIEMVFVLHHSKPYIPMTKREIRGITKALKTPGIDSMRHASYRIFVVGAAFWFPLERSVYCEWEDVATCLSLGLVFENLSEMRQRFKARKKYGPRKDRDPFHHFLNELLEMNYESDDGRKCTELVMMCHDLHANIA